MFPVLALADILWPFSQFRIAVIRLSLFGHPPSKFSAGVALQAQCETPRCSTSISTTPRHARMAALNTATPGSSAGL